MKFTRQCLLSHIFVLFVSFRMTDQDKEDFIRRVIAWKENGLDLDKRTCLTLNFGSDVVLDYPQIRWTTFYIQVFFSTFVCPFKCPVCNRLMNFFRMNLKQDVNLHAFNIGKWKDPTCADHTESFSSTVS